jgi:bacteriorhodopsin
MSKQMKQRLRYLVYGLGLAFVLALLFRLVFRTGLGWSRSEVTDAYLFFLTLLGVLVLLLAIVVGILEKRAQRRRTEIPPES